MMKVPACLFLLLLLVGCDTPSERIDVYAIDQRYACGDPIYTIIRTESLDSNTPRLIDRADYLNIYKKDKDIMKEIENAVSVSKKMNAANSNGTLSSKNDSLVGVEFSLDFLDEDKVSLFEKSRSFPRCYIFYFKGYFKNNKINSECAESNHFIVEEYKVMQRFPDCEKIEEKEEEIHLKKMRDTEAKSKGKVSP